MVCGEVGWWGRKGRWRCGGGCSVICVRERLMGCKRRHAFLPIAPRHAIDGIAVIVA